MLTYPVNMEHMKNAIDTFVGIFWYSLAMGPLIDRIKTSITN